MSRIATINRETKETQINMELTIDGTGKLSGSLPIPFFEHMLSHLAKYSLVNIDVHLKGDIEIDCHHSVEDTAIVLGKLFQKALGSKKGIFRFGCFILTMDEVLTTVAVDFSGRPYFKYTGPELGNMGKFGIYDSELTLEFFHKLSIHAAMNIHIKVEYGENRHHIHESIFKAFGFAIRNAIAIDDKRNMEVPSTKGSL